MLGTISSTSLERIAEGLDRLGRFLATRR